MSNKRTATTVIVAFLVWVPCGAFAQAQKPVSAPAPAMTQAAARPGQPITGAATDPAAGIATPADYVIGASDVLQVNFWRDKDLSVEVTVRPDGKVSLVNESMPAPLRAISYVVPARWFVLVARGVMLKGVGLRYLWQATLALAVMAFVLLAASTRAFHERLEG